MERGQLAGLDCDWHLGGGACKGKGEFPLTEEGIFLARHWVEAGVIRISFFEILPPPAQGLNCGFRIWIL